MEEENKDDELIRFEKSNEYILEQIMDLTVLLKDAGCITLDDFKRLNEKAKRIK